MQIPTPPALATDRIQLRPIEPNDVPPLYRLALHPEINHLWRYRGGTPSFDEFAAALFPGVVCQYVVSPVDRRDVIGHALSYNSDLRNGFTYAAVLMDSNTYATGLGTETFLLFINYLFSVWPLRKIYLETSEYNLTFFKSACDRGLLIEEGRLRGHMFLGGQYWDQVILACYREELLRAADGPLGRILKRSPN
jgi:RimJ/RimL family protein N-acetyltransferase